MKNARIITIACWLVTAIVLSGLVIWFISGNLFGISTGVNFSIGGIDTLTGSFNVVGTYTVPDDNIDSIDVNWVAGAISITPYDGNEIKITEYARRDLKDNEKLIYKVSDGKLEIQYASPSFSINMITKKLELLVPEAVADKLNTLDVDATSAELIVRGLEAKSFIVSETSGDSQISDIKSDKAKLHSVSGTFDITGLTTAELTLGTVSGEINLTDVTADSVLSNTTSGEQLLGGTFKDIDAGSVSGEIYITSTINPDRIICGTTSGDIRVTIPGNTDLTVSYSTVSGNFNSEIPVKTGGSAAYRFTSTSGDINLKAAS